MIAARKTTPQEKAVNSASRNPTTATRPAMPPTRTSWFARFSRTRRGVGRAFGDVGHGRSSPSGGRFQVAGGRPRCDRSVERNDHTGANVVIVSPARRGTAERRDSLPLAAGARQRRLLLGARQISSGRRPPREREPAVAVVGAAVHEDPGAQRDELLDVAIAEHARTAGAEQAAVLQTAKLGPADRQPPAVLQAADQQAANHAPADGHRAAFARVAALEAVDGATGRSIRAPLACTVTAMSSSSSSNAVPCA